MRPTNYNQKPEERYLEEQRFIRAQKKVKAIKGFYVHLFIFLGINLVLVVGNMLAQGDWRYVFIWQNHFGMFFWGIGVFFHGFGVFGMDLIFGKSWEDKKIKEIMDRDKHKYWE